MTFALIFENEIKNRFECDNYEHANIMARACFGNDAIAVCTDRYATVIGDKYIEGRFMRLENIDEEGIEHYVEVPYIPTELDRIYELTYKLEQSMENQSKVEKEKAILEEKVVQLQQLMSEIYEKSEV
jgi:hypothetical protein